MLGCSFITSHTHSGPSIVSSKKKRLTSGAVIYLGAKVIRTKGIATQKMPIVGIIIRSFPVKLNLSTKISAINATSNLPIMAEGTKFICFTDLIITVPAAKPIAQINPKKFPLKSPFSKESKKITLARYVIAGANVRFARVHNKTHKDILALDISLRRNDRKWNEKLSKDLNKLKHT